MENGHSQQRFRATHRGPSITNQSHAPALSSGQNRSGHEVSLQKTGYETQKANGRTENLKNFRDLKVWQTAKELAVAVYKTTQRFPQEEIHGLSSQMRRAAISISSNIAGGFNRFYKRDYQRFLMIALGSCGELESQIEVGGALGYLPKERREELLEKLDHENRMLRKLHSKLREDLPSLNSRTGTRDPSLLMNSAASLEY